MPPSLPNFKDSFFAAQLTSLINLCNPSYQAVLPYKKYVKIYRWSIEHKDQSVF